MNEYLQQHARSAGFLEVIRLLELLDFSQHSELKSLSPTLEGSASYPHQTWQFRTQIGLSFPTGAITGVELPGQSGAGERKSTIIVPFLSLVGPVGALPRHYTKAVIQRLLQKDSALAEFLEIFNKRLLTQFYRASMKYRLPASAQRAWPVKADRSNDAKLELNREPITRLLTFLVGWNRQSHSRRFDFSDRLPLFFAGAFTRSVRPVASLVGLLSHFLGMPVSVLEFCGQWLYLNDSDRTKFARSDDYSPVPLQLGVNCIAGNRIWDVQSKIRLQIGPVNYDRFSQLLPNGALFRGLCDLTRLYLGIEWNFDVEIILEPRQTKATKVGDRLNVSLLGWNTWSQTEPVDRPEFVVFASTPRN